MNLESFQIIARHKEILLLCGAYFKNVLPFNQAFLIYKEEWRD